MKMLSTRFHSFHDTNQHFALKRIVTKCFCHPENYRSKRRSRAEYCEPFCTKIISWKHKCQELQSAVIERKRRKEKTSVLETLHGEDLDILFFTFTDYMEMTRVTLSKSKTSSSLNRPILLRCKLQYQDPSKIILDFQ